LAFAQGSRHEVAEHELGASVVMGDGV